MRASFFFASDKQPGGKPQNRSRVIKSLVIFLLTIVISTWLTGTMYAVTPNRYKEQLTREAIIDLTNSARITEGLTTLEENQVLDTIAEARARDILEKQYFDHVSPTGEKASHIAIRAGYRYKVIAENLARGVFSTNSKLVDAWMKSPSHRKNILSDRVREIGVSVVTGTFNGSETWISVQIFGVRFDSTTNGSYRVASNRVPDNEVKMNTGSSEEGLHERIIRMKGELDAEQASIRRIQDNPQKNEELARRMQSYNEKLEKYNQTMAETRAIRLAMNQ